MRIIDRALKKLMTVKLYWLIGLSVVLSEILTGIIVSIMSVLFHGRVTHDLIITGIVTAFIVSLIIVSSIAYFIKQLQLSDEALRKSEELLSEAQRIAHIGSWTYDLAGHLTWSDETYRIYGVSPGVFTLNAEAFINLIHPDDRPAMQAWITACVAGEKPGEHEFRAILPDGAVRWIRGRGELKYEAENRPVYLTGTAQDITERKKFEKDLFQSKQDWEDIFNSITDMVTVHDTGYNIIHANKAAEKILGLPLITELKDNKCFKFYHGTNHPPEGCPSCDCLKTGLAATFEVFEHHLDKFIEIRAIPRFDSENRMIGLIHIVRDITERRKSEEQMQRLEDQLRQSQKMEAIGQLAGGIAHDFNNILTAIIGYSSLLKMKMNDNDPLINNIDQILASSERAANLTQSLLAFSRKQVTNPQPADLSGIINKVENLLKRIIGEDVELKIILADAPLTTMADSGQIQQVLMNLSTNARDAMPKGGALTISTEAIDADEGFIKSHGFGEPGSYALIEISDTGAGMDEKTRDRIFEPFFTTKEAGKGTGLGLTMVYGIVKQHNGYINVYSEQGHGTTFKIYLPLISAAAHKESKKEEAAVFFGSGETILLAEDDDDVRIFTKALLEEAGYEVIVASNGQDAVRLFRENEHKIDLLLFDVIMPLLSGKDAYTRIKRIRSDIKVLFTSGYPADFIRAHEITGDKLNYIAKPALPGELLKIVREILKTD